MASKSTLGFGAETVRVALTSGLPRRQVAADFEIGVLTLSRLCEMMDLSPRGYRAGRSRAAG